MFSLRFFKASKGKPDFLKTHPIEDANTRIDFQAVIDQSPENAFISTPVDSATDENNERPLLTHLLKFDPKDRGETRKERFFYICDKGVIIAAVTMERIKDDSIDDNYTNDGLTLTDLSVRKEYRGKGIGRALIKHVMEECLSNGKMLIPDLKKVKGWEEGRNYCMRIIPQLHKEVPGTLILYSGLGMPHNYTKPYVLVERSENNGPEEIFMESPDLENRKILDTPQSEMA